MWDIQRTVPIDAWLRTRTVIGFKLREAARAETASVPRVVG